MIKIIDNGIGIPAELLAEVFEPVRQVDTSIERSQGGIGLALVKTLVEMHGGTVRADPATRDALLIALSGYGQNEDRQRAREAGFDHHFVKPIEPNALRAWLAKYWQAGHDKEAEY